MFEHTSSPFPNNRLDNSYKFPHFPTEQVQFRIPKSRERIILEFSNFQLHIEAFFILAKDLDGQPVSFVRLGSGMR